MFFFVLLLFLSYKMLSNRNKIIQLELKDVSYSELITFNKNIMVTINDSSKLRDILLMLNSLKGEKVDFDSDEYSDFVFINVYDKSFNKLEFFKTDRFLKINNQWYKLDRTSAARFNKIFEKYSSQN